MLRACDTRTKLCLIMIIPNYILACVVMYTGIIHEYTRNTLQM